MRREHNRNHPIARGAFVRVGGAFSLSQVSARQAVQEPQRVRAECLSGGQSRIEHGWRQGLERPAFPACSRLRRPLVRFRRRGSGRATTGSGAWATRFRAAAPAQSKLLEDDAVDGAHSTASMCQRVVVLKRTTMRGAVHGRG